MQVFIDGNKLIDKTLSTNISLDVCLFDGQVITSGKEGVHTIKVVINDSITKTESFPLDNDLYIGVNYDRQLSKISFDYSKYKFMYE